MYYFFIELKKRNNILYSINGSLHESKVSFFCIKGHFFTN